MPGTKEAILADCVDHTASTGIPVHATVYDDVCYLLYEKLVDNTEAEAICSGLMSDHGGALLAVVEWKEMQDHLLSNLVVSKTRIMKWPRSTVPSHRNPTSPRRTSLKYTSTALRSAQPGSSRLTADNGFPITKATNISPKTRRTLVMWFFSPESARQSSRHVHDAQGQHHRVWPQSRRLHHPNGVSVVWQTRISV